MDHGAQLIHESAERVSKIVHEEERRFAHTIDTGLSRLDADLQDLRKKLADSQRIAAARDPLGEFGITQAELAQHQYQVANGMRYRGESVIACILDERGFASNCPTVGCTSDPPARPRPAK